ncbi:unnamed protein product, partial [Laminaria digitata]
GAEERQQEESVIYAPAGVRSAERDRAGIRYGDREAVVQQRRGGKGGSPHQALPFPCSEAAPNRLHLRSGGRDDRGFPRPVQRRPRGRKLVFPSADQGEDSNVPGRAHSGGSPRSTQESPSEDHDNCGERSTGPNPQLRRQDRHLAHLCHENRRTIVQEEEEGGRVRVRLSSSTRSGTRTGTSTSFCLRSRRRCRGNVRSA